MGRDPGSTYEADAGKLLKKSPALVPSATADTYGATVEIDANTDNNVLIPRYIALRVTGTDGDAELVTLKVVANYEDGTASSAVTVVCTAGTDGTYEIATSAYRTLGKDGGYIKSLTLSAKSSISTTAATVHCDVFAFS